MANGRIRNPIACHNYSFCDCVKSM